jgi:DNA-binding CsgD family transcriptional regulator
MDDDRFARLTPRQLDCLRLLPVKGSSKGVAEALRISPGTVDQHLKSARRMLGVNDSWMASQMVLRHLRAHPQKLDNQPEAVADPPEPSTVSTGTDDRSEGQGDSGGSGNSGWKKPPPTRRIPSLSAVLFPPVGRPPNDLSTRSRLSLIAVQALLAISAVSMLFALVYTMSRLLIVLNRHGG